MYRDQRLEQTRRWKQEHREEQRAYMVKWRKANPEKLAQYERARRARRHAVELESYGGLDAIFERDGGRCSYCGIRVHRTTDQIDYQQATLDHIAPVSLGGPDVAWNVVLACRLCNNRKQALSLERWLASSAREA